MYNCKTIMQVSRRNVKLAVFDPVLFLEATMLCNVHFVTENPLFYPVMDYRHWDLLRCLHIISNYSGHRVLSY